MNVQEAKELEITEGNVRTIHDSDGKLLWGRLAYSTTYDGDSSQQTYSGKNLFNRNDIALGKSWSGGIGTTCYPFTSANTRAVILIPAKANTTYNIHLYESEWYTMQIMGVDSSYIIETAHFIGTSAENTNQLDRSFTTTANTAYIGIKFKYGSAGTTPPAENMIPELYLQLEEGSTSTSYEPYVGGTASPNPSYPQTVNVVTGTQTITVTDGDDATDTYTVNLGAIELAKIGEYQDYIYKSGDDWYIHKEIGKYTFDGSETWTTDSYGTNSWRKDHLFSVANYSQNAIVLLADIAQSVSYSDRTNHDNPPTCVCFYSDTNERFWIRNTTLTTLAQVQSATTGKSVYYLATATDTKITDSSLISQLEAVQEFLTRYGYQSTVVGDIPIIINQTALV